MGERTAIEWTDFTFNPWWGCTRVSPGCDNCYAESWARRFGAKWGTGETRRPASERTWSEPLKWNAKAAKDGVRRRVFCASMADVFDNEGLPAERERLWNLIELTPSLDWLLLTKRVGNVIDMIPKRWADARDGLPRNIWLGATVVNQEEADRDIPKLLRVPAAVRFLSCEPLLSDLDLLPWLGTFKTSFGVEPGVDWVIVGGESGPKARPMHSDWARSLRDQCNAARVPFFFKQHGEWIDWRQTEASEWTNTTCGNKSPCRGKLRRGEIELYDGASFETIHTDGPNATVFCRVGKKAAGRFLDGRTWDEFPRVAA
jgi:protein gp37